MFHCTYFNIYQLIVSIIFRGVFRTLPCQKSMMKFFLKVHNTVDTGRPGRLLNVLYTFNLFYTSFIYGEQLFSVSYYFKKGPEVAVRKYSSKQVFLKIS